MGIEMTDERKKRFAERVSQSLANALAAIIVVFPCTILLLWGAKHVGAFAWADFPDPTLRQMVLVAFFATFVAAR
jgi:hypothetical protein